MGGDIFSSRSGFLKSVQLITGSTSLLYKGSDGTSRILNPDNYQPKGSYAAANHNHSGVYQPVGSYATTTQLNEVKTSVSNGKSLIASAITDKGVSTASDATFQTMANNIRSIVPMSSPKLIPGNILWSIGTTDIYGKPEYSAYTPPIFAQDPNCIIVGHKILSNYNTITGKSSVSTSGFVYYFYNIINGNMYIIRPSSGFTTALTNNVKNGDPYIIILSCPNSAGSSHKVILLK